MPRKKRTWIRWLSFLLLTATAVVAVFLSRSLHAFFVEDRIHGTFYPVARALYSYEQDSGHPASSLEVIIPKYIPAIPSSSLADPPTYRVLPPGNVWELAIHSQALSQPRLYICRSSQEFTPEEKRRIIRQYHVTWTVFPADR